jgi:uncharacterized protein (DUF779 family)|tara:strand:- start:44 stop:265 length:222 start_codon:yes stop_codon:yes gene_type:complete
MTIGELQELINDKPHEMSDDTWKHTKINIAVLRSRGTNFDYEILEILKTRKSGIQQIDELFCLKADENLKARR